MATKAQIDRLAQRIEALSGLTSTCFERQAETWIVEGDKAWPRDDPERVITYAELQARPAARIENRIVHADSGRPAACCLPGGACYAVHGATTN
jgi:hypothetical protein